MITMTAEAAEVLDRIDTLLEGRVTPSTRAFLTSVASYIARTGKVSPDQAAVVLRVRQDDAEVSLRLPSEALTQRRSRRYEGWERQRW